MKSRSGFVGWVALLTLCLLHSGTAWSAAADGIALHDRPIELLTLKSDLVFPEGVRTLTLKRSPQDRAACSVLIDPREAWAQKVPAGANLSLSVVETLSDTDVTRMIFRVQGKSTVVQIDCWNGQGTYPSLGSVRAALETVFQVTTRIQFSRPPQEITRLWNAPAAPWKSREAEYLSKVLPGESSTEEAEDPWKGILRNDGAGDPKPAEEFNPANRAI